MVLRSENTFPATPEHVRDARSAIAELVRRAGVPDDALDAIRLAVSEAVSNAVLHGYRGDTGRGDVTVLVEAEDSRLEVRVRDRGCGMSPHPDARGAGMGLPLIAQLSDAVAVRPNDEGGGTEVHMTFRLAAPVAD
jgi:serine/threonine-protein kinase RsbW/stage II sporulation protein AB (anti-sigma F factor)